MSLFSSLGKFKYILEQYNKSKNDDSPLNTLKDLLYNGDKYDSTKQHNTLKELGNLIIDKNFILY